MFKRDELLEAVIDDMFDKDVLIRDLLNWMTEADIKEFMDANGYDLEEG